MAKRQVLVISDDPDPVARILSQEGYRVYRAFRGEEGLELMYCHCPDLLILEAIAPELDGWEICRLIREVSDVPVIMLTGKAKTEEDIVRGLESGADDYFFKPFQPQELVARVQAVLRRVKLPPLYKKGKCEA